MNEESAALSEAALGNARRAAAWCVGAMLLTTLGGVVIGVGLSRQVVRPLHDAIEVASSVAAGDLTRVVSVQRRDETGRLMQAIADMQANLARLVGTVRGNAESVATASQQIALGSNDLATRTEHQAAALQETASSMEELDSTVRRNADGAQQASELARTASDVASRGGDLMAQVVQTMAGISDSSQRIAEITGVIDGIAFQTNILALNAAVEAARAGEQGRGFAVVAEEVRALAHRSATAAREVKTLIDQSVGRIDQGSTLVDGAGRTMGEVVASIHRVSEIIAEISRASFEQSAGVRVVGNTVNQMDQATQQNAALVEQTAAAAEGLRQQAQQLVQAISVFRVVSA